MIVDDSTALRDRLVSLLSAMTHLQIVGEARDGIEALAAVGQLAPTLLILDLRMPRLNGFEVLRAVTQTHPQCRVIVLSALADQTTRQKCLELGACCAFDKVTQFDEFVQTIECL